MIILAIDTTSPYCGVALFDGNNCLGEININGGNTHSVVLMPAIDTLLKGANIKITDIDLFAVTAGPGSFTGVRIGVSTVKGLAMGMNKPVMCPSTLRCLAENLNGINGILCPVMDARRGQFYNALFTCNDGKIERLTEDRLIEGDKLDKELKKLGRIVYLVGDGYNLARKTLTYEKIKDTPNLLIAPNAVSVARVGLEEYVNNPSSAKNDLEAAPVYLRASQAERERKERLEGKANS